MAKFEKKQMICPDGKSRWGRVLANRTGTGTLVTAEVPVKGRWVSGKLNTETEVFLPNPNGKHVNVFSSDYKTGKGYIAHPIEYVDSKEKVVPTEVLTLYDLQRAEGEAKLTAGEVENVVSVLLSYAETVGVGMVCNKKRLLQVLHNLHNLPEKAELACLQVRPKVAIDLADDWAGRLMLVLGYFNLHASTK